METGSGVGVDSMNLEIEYPEIAGLKSILQPDRINVEAILADRKGWGVKRHNRKRIGFLVLAAPLLSKMLWEGEVVEDVVRGVRVSSLEYLFAGGYWSRYVNFTTMIVTSHRLLLINTDSKGNPKDMLYHQARFNSFKKISTGLFGSVTFKFVDGKKFIFNEVKRSDKKRLKQRLEAKQAEPAAAPVTAPLGQVLGCEDLCTTCYWPVPKGLYTCGNCQTEFRTPRTAALRSLILPGLGDLYLRHHTLAVLEIIGSIIVYIVLINAVIQSGESGFLIVLPIIAVIAIVNGLDAIATYFIAKKGLIPLEKPAR